MFNFLPCLFTIFLKSMLLTLFIGHVLAKKNKQKTFASIFQRVINRWMDMVSLGSGLPLWLSGLVLDTNGEVVDHR